MSPSPQLDPARSVLSIQGASVTGIRGGATVNPSVQHSNHESSWDQSKSFDFAKMRGFIKEKFPKYYPYAAGGAVVGTVTYGVCYTIGLFGVTALTPITPFILGGAILGMLAYKAYKKLKNC
jgi:hypothetical protein